jgi:hypothetical protein
MGRARSRMKTMTRELGFQALQIALGAAILLTVVAINRSPFIFYDTSHYLQFGKSIIERLPIVNSLGTNATAEPKAGSTDAAVSLIAKGKREHPSLSYAGGRSPYYSVFLFVSAKLGGFWATVLTQAGVASWMLWLAMQAFAPRSYRGPKSYFCIVAALTAASPLGLYVGMAMPDVFTGFALLGTGLIVFGLDRFSISALICLVLATAGCAVTHATSTIVCAIGLGSVAISAVALMGRTGFGYASRLLWGLTPIVLATMASGAFQLATLAAFGASPKSPPYIMARLLADGTGRAYLRDACHPHQQYALCKFEDRQFRNQDDFLWSGDPKVGVFLVSDYDTRSTLQAEELRFALGTIASYPLWQVQKSAEHWGSQLLTFGLYEFKVAAETWDAMAFNETVPELAPSYKASLAYQGKLPFVWFEWVHWLVLIMSIAWLFYWLSCPEVLANIRRPTGCQNVWVFWIIAAAGLAAALVGNAGLCGTLSGVYDRYEARLIWLVPLFALLLYLNMRKDPSRFRERPDLVLIHRKKHDSGLRLVLRSSEFE